MLESMADGDGAWKVLDTFGKPLSDMPDDLVADILQLRRIATIMRSQILRDKLKPKSHAAKYG